MGYSIGIGDFGTDRYRISVVNGYRLFKFLSLGLGTGFHYYKDSKAAIVPLFLDISINITSKNVSPYFSFATGYSFDAANNFDKFGLYLSPNIGVNIKQQKRLSFNIGVGYEYQMMNYRTKHYVYYIPYYTPTWYSSSIENNGAISIFAGISF